MLLTDRRFRRIVRAHKLDESKFTRIAPATSTRLDPGLAVEYEDFPGIAIAYHGSDLRAFDMACRIIRDWLDAEQRGVSYDQWTFGLSEPPKVT